MGKLVSIAQSVENEVSTLRVRAEPILRSKFKEAQAEWLQFKSRTPRSRISRWELESNAFLMRTEARIRSNLAGIIGKTGVELEKSRTKLLRNTSR